MSRIADRYREPARRGHFGLYYKDNDGITHPIPLKTIDVNVRIIDSIARVEYSQVYQNNTPNPLHVDYIFPISTGSCFESFSVKYKSYTMEGEIHKKKHAKKKFKDAVREGKTAVYAEISEESKDLMLVKIGNMEPDTSMTINLSYIEQLDTSANKLWKYTVLGGLKPRYSSPSAARNVNQNSNDQDISILNYPYVTSTEPGAYTWKIRVEIESRSKINFVECPAYKIQTEYEEMVKAVIQLDPSEEFTPTKDFTIYYSTEGINKPQALLTCYEDGYCALLNFMPQTNQKTLDDAYRAELESDGVPDIEFEKTNSEFIFLLDRSGSMSGSSIRMAREALVIFLKSLPAKAYFNIVSFGGHYEIYNRSGSLPASQDNINDATRDVMRYEGDMGGTEILKALEAVYQIKSQPGYKKKIFLLTDGEVNENKPIYKSIQKHADQARVFSIGIGTSACRELIIQSAHYGKGCYEFVDDVHKIGERVMSLLTLSMQICAHSFQLTFPMGLDAKMVVPHPEIVGPVYEGKYLSFFVYFDKQIAKRESVKLSLVYKRDEQEEGSQQTIELSVKDCLSDANPLNNAIWKLGYHKLFSLFESDKDKSTDSIVLFGGAPLTRHDVEPLSVKYGVLSYKTAFVCVSKDVNQNVLSTVHSEVVVPHVLGTEETGARKRRNARSKSRSRSRSRSMSSADYEFEEYAALPDVDDDYCWLGEENSMAPRLQLATKAARKSAPLTGGVRGGRGGHGGGLMKKKKMTNDRRDRRSRSRSRSVERGTNSKGKERERDRERSRKRSKSPLKSFGVMEMRSQQVYDAPAMNFIPQASEFKARSAPQEMLLERLAMNTYGSLSQVQSQAQAQVPVKAKQESTYDQVFSLIRQQESQGKWEYSQTLLSQLGIDEKALESLIPEMIKQKKYAQAIIMTALVLICLKQKFAEHKKVWTLVFKKGEGFLKDQGVALQDFKSFESLC